MTWRKCCEGRVLGASWESWSAQRPLVGFLEERAFEVRVEVIGPYLGNGKRELRERVLLLTRPVGHGVGLLSNPCGHCGISESGGSRMAGHLCLGENSGFRGQSCFSPSSIWE